MRSFKLVGLALAAVALSAQGAGAIVFAGHDYFVTSAASDWLMAEHDALSYGGHLVSINSAAEQTFIEDNLLVGALAGRPVWIGLSDRAVEGTFVWSDGSPLG